MAATIGRPSSTKAADKQNSGTSHECACPIDRIDDPDAGAAQTRICAAVSPDNQPSPGKAVDTQSQDAIDRQVGGRDW